MIVCASRRTDIPAFYSDWFYNRVKKGFVYVRNPRNMYQINKIPINKEVVDCIVFWTKNPSKMIKHLNELRDYNYYFQFTLNAYNNLIESNVPRKSKIFDVFKKLSDMIGSERIIWRYDPIFLSEDIDINYHLKNFEKIADKLSGYSNSCVISFFDNYKKTERNIKPLSARELNEFEAETLAKEITVIAKENKFNIQTCAEKYNFKNIDIERGRCIDKELIEKLIGSKLNITKDKNRRDNCGCIESIDIGEHNTCMHKCLYCYTNYNQETAEKNYQIHHPDSPLLIGDIGKKDIIKIRKAVSSVNN